MKTCEVPRPGTRIQRLLPPLPSKKSLCLARRERDRHGPWAHVASRRPTLAAGPPLQLRVSDSFAFLW